MNHPSCPLRFKSFKTRQTNCHSTREDFSLQEYSTKEKKKRFQKGAENKMETEIEKAH